jgi:hypothetical protein
MNETTTKIDIQIIKLGEDYIFKVSGDNFKLFNAGKYGNMNDVLKAINKTVKSMKVE